VKLVVVTWNDAWQADEGEKIAHRPFVQRSCGFLVKSDKTGVTLAGCIDEDGTMYRGLFVPRGVIVRVERVG
jgi:hypothetical protein